jgi:hypothetical protein
VSYLLFNDKAVPCCNKVVGFFCMFNYHHFKMCIKLQYIDSGTLGTPVPFPFNITTHDFHRIPKLQQGLTSIVWLQMSYWHINNKIRRIKQYMQLL